MPQCKTAEWKIRIPKVKSTAMIQRDIVVVFYCQKDIVDNGPFVMTTHSCLIELIYWFKAAAFLLKIVI